MILRALGYDQNNEFKGSGWELRTASEARRLGILNNVTGDLGSYATREMVAEILFRAILCETVTYSPMNQNGYLETGKTLAKQNLDLEEVEGVVTANEYANLDGTSTLPTDKTQLDDYRIDYHTTLDDIGESRLAYIHKGSTVLSIADTGKNNTAESTNYEKNLDAVKAEAGVTGDGETFVNFDKRATRTSDWRIKYVLKADTNNLIDGADLQTVCANINAYNSRNVAKVVNNTVEVILPPHTEILSIDLNYIRAIFGHADKNDVGYIDGEVYVGTQSINDISDDYNYSYEKFKDEFIEEGEIAPVSDNERGNWVKVIDNDGDGKTDYIFKVVYTVAQIASVKDDTYTLDTKNHALAVHHPDADWGDEIYFNNVTSQKVVATNGETFERGDVVYYAVIDGNAQTVKCDTVTAQIEKVDHNKLIATTTDGTEYTESQVCEHIEDEAYEARVRKLSGKVSYELYFDRGGYLAAFVKTDKVGDFQLITDGWYDRLKVNEEYAVRVYNDETGKQDIVDITANGSLFIGSNNGTLNNNWHALKALGGANGVLNATGNDVRTTVAAITADGTILPVENSAVTGRYDHAMIDMVKTDGTFNIPLRTTAKGDVYYTDNGSPIAYNRNTRQQVDVRALDNTIYYVAYPDPAMESGVHVLSYTGYNSGIKGDFENWVTKEYVEDVYAVGTRHISENNLADTVDYYTADVVVIELNHYDQAGELVLVLDDTARFSDVRLRDVQIIDSKGELKTVTVNWTGRTLSYSDGIDNHKQIQPGLYYLHATSEDNVYTLRDENADLTYRPLDAEAILKTGCIAVGQVKHHEWLANNKYVVVEKFAYDGVDVNGEALTVNTDKEDQYDLSEETPLYTVTYDQPDSRYGYYESVPTVSQANHDVVFAARMDETNNVALQDFRDATRENANHNRTYYNWNDVLVYYKNNAVVYAVSFDNIYTDGPTRYSDDYAQVLWRNVTPAAANTTLGVSFYGVGDQLDGDENVDPLKITVSYDTALAWYEAHKNDTKANPLTVNNATTSFITKVVNGVRTPVDEIPAAPEKDGPVYELNIQKSNAWQVWTLAVEAADPNYGLFFNGTPVSTNENEPYEYRGVETTLANVQAQFTSDSKFVVKDKDGNPVNYNGTWKWFDKDNKPVYGADDQTVFGEGFKAVVTVEAQNGETEIYYIVCHKTGYVPEAPYAGPVAVSAGLFVQFEGEDPIPVNIGEEDLTLTAINKTAVDGAFTLSSADLINASERVTFDVVKLIVTDSNGVVETITTASPWTVKTTGEAVSIQVIVDMDSVEEKDPGTPADPSTPDVPVEPSDPENPDPVDPPAGNGGNTETEGGSISTGKDDDGGFDNVEEVPFPFAEQTLAIGDKIGIKITVKVGFELRQPVVAMGCKVVGVIHEEGSTEYTLGLEMTTSGKYRLVITSDKIKTAPTEKEYTAAENKLAALVTEDVLAQLTEAQKTELNAFVAEQKAEIRKVDDIDKLEAAVETATTAINAKIAELTGKAPSQEEKDAEIAKLTALLTEEVLAKLTDEQKAELNKVVADETAKIQAVDDKANLKTVSDAAVEAVNAKIAELTKTEPTGDVTVNVKGRAVMENEGKLTATGTAEKVTFTLKMAADKPNWRPNPVPNATGAATGWSAASNVKMEVAEDGLTWTVTVTGAKDGMTLDFGAVQLHSITVTKNADISDLTPEVRYMIKDGKFEFRFNVVAGKTPSVSGSGFEYSLVKGTTANSWVLTVEPTDINSDIAVTLSCAATKSVTINVNPTSTITDKTQKKVDIVGNRIEFTTAVRRDTDVPVANGPVDEGGNDKISWTYKYDETTKTWTVIGTAADWTGITSANLSAMGQTAVKINKGDGVEAISRGMVYPCELVENAEGAKVLTVKVTLAPDCTVGSGNSNISWAAAVNGVSNVTIKEAALKTGSNFKESITLTATPAPNPTLSAAGDEGSIYISGKKGVYDSTTNKTTFTLGKSDIDSNVTIKKEDIKKGDPAAPVTGATVTRNEDGTWTIVVPFTATPRDTAYTVSSTPLHTITMTAGEDVEEGTVQIGAATTEDKYDLTKKTTLQFKVKEDVGHAIALAADCDASIVVPATGKPNTAASGNGWVAYDVEFTNQALSIAGADVALVITTEERQNYTVTVDAHNAGQDWDVVTEELVDNQITTNLDFVTITLNMNPNLFPLVRDADDCNVSYAEEKELTSDGRKVWNITLSGIDANKNIVIESVEKVHIIRTGDYEDTQNYVIGGPLADGEFTVEETMDADGLHTVKIVGKNVTKWVDEAWFTAAAEDGLADGAVFDGFYGPTTGTNKTWSWFKTQEHFDDTVEKAALIGYYLPGRIVTGDSEPETDTEPGCSGSSFVAGDKKSTYNWRNTEPGGVPYIVEITITMSTNANTKMPAYVE